MFNAIAQPLCWVIVFFCTCVLAFIRLRMCWKSDPCNSFRWCSSCYTLESVATNFLCEVKWNKCSSGTSALSTQRRWFKSSLWWLFHELQDLSRLLNMRGRVQLHYKPLSRRFWNFYSWVKGEWMWCKFERVSFWQIIWYIDDNVYAFRRNHEYSCKMFICNNILHCSLRIKRLVKSAS